MKKTLDILRRLQADSIVLYMKIHNYHWNVKGADFPQVHKKLEEIYEYFADMFDDLAERISQLGGIPVVTLAEALKLSKIKEESKTSFNSKEITKEVLKIYENLKEEFENLANVADKNDDRVTASYCDDKLSELEKSIWMLKAQIG